MNKKVALLLLILISLLIGSIINYRSLEKYKEQESHISQSLDGRLAIYLESGRMHDADYCKVFIFDTAVYPNLKEAGVFPSKLQKNNPKALFFIPIKFYARITDFEWNDKNNKVSIKQAAVNHEKALNYEIDLNSFSFYKKDE